MFTKEGLEEINKGLKTVDIKGKKYAMVNERVQAFRELCPGGCIETELINNENGICVVKATIKDEENFTVATGLAFESQSASFINKTSYIENCETSAIGRALGFAGIGVDESLATADEVANAIKNQDEKPITEKQFNFLNSLIKKANVDPKALAKQYGVESFMTLPMNRFDELKTRLEKAINK